MSFLTVLPLILSLAEPYTVAERTWTGAQLARIRRSSLLPTNGIRRDGGDVRAPALSSNKSVRNLVDPDPVIADRWR